MAFLHRTATLVPSKLELIGAWLPRQTWTHGLDLTGLEPAGSYRFDDPDGEVGIETFLLRSGDGHLVQVPLTYRAEPLADADGALVGTTDHSALGKRWVYDGCIDPVYVLACASVIATGGREADLEYEQDGRTLTRAAATKVRGSGSGVALAPLAAVVTTVAGSVSSVRTDAFTLLVRRRLDRPFDVAGEVLTGTWPGSEQPTVLAVLRTD